MAYLVESRRREQGGRENFVIMIDSNFLGPNNGKQGLKDVFISHKLFHIHEHGTWTQNRVIFFHVYEYAPETLTRGYLTMHS